MSGVKELIRTEENGTLSFGNYELAEKSKRSDFEFGGDVYKVKTYADITKLEKNGLFVYESVPGTAVEHFRVDDRNVEFLVEGSQDAQVTLQLEEDCEYEVFVDDAAVGGMKTNRSGKLVIGVELNEGTAVKVKVVRK